MAMEVKNKDSGKLRIGDDWNAVRIIVLSQSNPLKAIAEFVENSIDAQAKTITIMPMGFLQLRYLVRLYAKELVLKDFAGASADQLLERMIELSLHAEEKLKSG